MNICMSGLHRQTHTWSLDSLTTHLVNESPEVHPRVRGDLGLPLPHQQPHCQVLHLSEGLQLCQVLSVEGEVQNHLVQSKTGIIRSVDTVHVCTSGFYTGLFCWGRGDFFGIIVCENHTPPLPEKAWKIASLRLILVGFGS